MAYEFQSMLHRNLSSMLDAIAYEFMTAGGANSPEMVDGLLGEPAALAAECIEGWGLDQADMWDAEAQSHMDQHGYSAADLAEAIAGFIAARPDRDNG